MTKTYQLETLTCPSCVMRIEGAVKKMKEVKDVQVLFNASKVKVTLADGSDDGSKVRKTIEGLGYSILGEN